VTDPSPHPSDPPDGGQAEASLGWEDEVPEVVLKKVRSLFSTLTKAIRAFQLYDENNPVYQRFVSGLADAFRDLWSEVDRLPVHVEERRIVWMGEEVYSSDNRSESLAFLLYKDGIREVTFHPGIEDEELPRLLEVLQRARNLRPEADDLLTILWEEDFEHFEHTYIDVLVEGVSLPESGEGHEEIELRSVLEGEVGGAGSLDPEAEDAEEGEAGTAAPEPPSGQVSTEDFNPTLYSLDAKEMKQLEEELQEEMDRDLRRSVLEALFDRLENPERRGLDILKTLLPNFLSRGALRPAAAVLHELDALMAVEGMFDEERAARADEVLETVSGPETIGELVRALVDGSIEPRVSSLSTFLKFLRPSALAPLLKASEEVDDRNVQSTLREAITSIASRHPDAVLELLEGVDPVVMAGAARLAGRMELRDAGPKLTALLRHDSPEVRLAAVESAVSLRASTVAGTLEEVLDDPDRAVRIAAARALGTLRYRPAAPRIEEIVGGKKIRDRDVTEMIAFFESYGELAGDEAVSLLDKFLNRKGFLGRREPDEVRACAALALGKVDSPAAREALEKARDQEEPVVRSAVNRALRGDEEQGGIGG